jgi:hypothetical protein
MEDPLARQALSDPCHKLRYQRYDWSLNTA